MLLMPHRKESSASTIFTGKQSKIASGGYRPLLHTRGERPSCCCSADELNELTSRMPSLEGTWSGGLKAPDCACSMRTKIVNATPKIPRGTIIGRQTGGPLSEAEHYVKCGLCGGYSNIFDLGAVLSTRSPCPSGMRAGAITSIEIDRGSGGL
jgi:hypothetical protein